MNITPDLLLAFQQLADAAWTDDTDDGQTRSALASANRAYMDAVAGTFTPEDAALFLREKLMVAAYCAEDAGLEEIYSAIVTLAVALDVNLFPEAVTDAAKNN